MCYFVENESTEPVVSHRQVEISGVWLDGGLVVGSAQTDSVCARAAGDALLVDCTSLSEFVLLLESISV